VQHGEAQRIGHIAFSKKGRRTRVRGLAVMSLR
jgi:hypothetical protein